MVLIIDSSILFIAGQALPSCFSGHSFSLSFGQLLEWDGKPPEEDGEEKMMSRVLLFLIFSQGSAMGKVFFYVSSKLPIN